MPFKIRTKLLIAFLAIIFPFTIIAGILVFYNASAFHKAAHKVETVSEERAAITNIILALERSLMPGNDYIITADRKYIDDFYKASQEVEKRMKEAEGVVSGAEDMNMLGDTEVAWRNIKEISQRIFGIPDPHGNKAAANLMEEMDYRWAYPAIERLKKWRGMHLEEYKKAVNISQSVWVRSWTIMGIVVVMLIISGVAFAGYYSNLFAKPIQSIHESADSIAKGDFKTRLDIKTGDEIQQLAGAMNEMAAQLQGFYSTLEDQVRERTEELRESEERFRIIAETAADAIINMKQPGVVTLWNRSAERMFGYAADEVIGKNLHDFIVPERYREKSRDGLKVFFETGSGPVVGNTIEITALRKDGSEFPVELSISAMRIKDEWQTAAIIRDITERKKAEEALKEREERYRCLIESVTDYIFTVKVENGRPVSCTHGPGSVAITGYSSEEFDRDPFLWLNMVHEEDRETVKDWTEKILTGKAEPLEHRIIHKDGRVRWIRNTPVPHYDDKGQVVAYDGLISDITERKEAENRLKETRDYLDNLFNYANAPIIVWNPAFRITRFNHAFEHFTGYKADEVIGKDLGLLFPEASQKESMEKIISTSGGEFWDSVEIPIIRKDGDVRIALWNSANIYGDDGKTLIATIAQGQNFTERKKAEEELAKHVDELERYMKATVQREFRIKELRDRVEELEKRLKG